MMTNNCSFGVLPYANTSDTSDKTFSNQLNDVTKILQNTLRLNDLESENFIHDFNIDSKKISDTYDAISEQETNPILFPTEIIKKESVITGKIIGSGSFGIVYEHPENKNLVIKK